MVVAEPPWTAVHPRSQRTQAHLPTAQGGFLCGRHALWCATPGHKPGSQTQWMHVGAVDEVPHARIIPRCVVGRKNAETPAVHIENVIRAGGHGEVPRAEPALTNQYLSHLGGCGERLPGRPERG
jgi:hypothetical protein